MAAVEEPVWPDGGDALTGAAGCGDADDAAVPNDVRPVESDVENILALCGIQNLAVVET